MEKQLLELQQRVKKEHRDLVKYVQHVFQALNKKAEERRKLAASNALAGIKINGREEKIFYDTIYETKKLLFDVLEKTIEDFEHVGDKNWDKFYGE